MAFSYTLHWETEYPYYLYVAKFLDIFRAKLHENLKSHSITSENFGPMICSVVGIHHQIQVQTISARTEIL